MILHKVAQGSPEWHQSRAGVITASKVKEIRDRYKSGERKGEFKDSTHDYAFRLAIERISGSTIDDDGQYDTWAMKRGRELEPEARRAHEVRTGLLVEPVGFVTDDARWFGASADGFIDDNAGAEYKCWLSPEKLRPIFLSNDEKEQVADVMDQCQTGMWVTGRKEWHFVLYCPALSVVQRSMTMFVIKRDEAWIAAMEKDLMAFKALVMSYERKLRGEQ